MSIIDDLRKDANEWIITLTEDERRAIKKYTYNSNASSKVISDKFYYRLNAMLRGEIATDDTLLKYSNLIYSALNKYKTKRAFVCYRRVNDNPIEGYSIGDYFTLDQYISTSVIETKAFQGMYEMIIDIPVGCSAAYIEQLSSYPKQREVLINKDCVYKLTSFTNNIIKLEVVS